MRSSDKRASGLTKVLQQGGSFSTRVFFQLNKQNPRICRITLVTFLRTSDYGCGRSSCRRWRRKGSFTTERVVVRRSALQKPTFKNYCVPICLVELLHTRVLNRRHGAFEVSSLMRLKLKCVRMSYNYGRLRLAFVVCINYAVNALTTH